MVIRALASGLVALALALASGQPMGNNMAVNWTQVTAYSAAKKLALMPRGCTCLQGSKTAATCTYFTCDCSCDVTAAKCDAGCCCDADCSAKEKAAFLIGVGCAVNPTASTRTRKCVDAKTVTKVNPKYRMRVETVADPFGDLLCVELDNSESLGEFFVDPGSQAADTVFRSNDNAKRQYEIEPVAYATAASSSGLEFIAGDRLPALTTACAAGTARCASGGGFLGLPAADFMGSCNQRNYAGFMQPTSTSCMRKTTALVATTSNDACVAGFSLDRVRCVPIACAPPPVPVPPARACHLT